MHVRFARLLLVVTVLLAGVTLSATAGASQDTPRRGYEVRNLDTLGGIASGATSINNRGWIAGFSNQSSNETVHATRWLGGEIDDLGTLGGPNSAILWPVENVGGMLVGISETADIDPYDEAWSCSFFFPGEHTEHVCAGFVWEDGEMTALPTLGGTHGFATGANNRGQVVGWAENTVEGDDCVAPQRFQFRAVLWEKQRGEWQARELPPLPGDEVSAATAINDRGQVVGISGICDIAVGRFSARHAVIWDTDGSVTDIGNLGGIAWNTPMAINEFGQVVGFSNVSPDDGGNFVEGAFYWSKREGIVSLGKLSGDVDSQALGINNWGQIVGQSCIGPNNCRAVIWKNRHAEIQNLNDLTRNSYPDHLAVANDINDWGQITGSARLNDSDEVVAYLATPPWLSWWSD